MIVRARSASIVWRSSAILTAAVITAFVIVLWPQIHTHVMSPMSDVHNYLAAGERLNSGHPLYSLSPGDRDVLLYPPRVRFPLLSPPPIAVAWRTLALLGELGATIWLVIVDGALVLTVVYVILRGTVVAHVGLILLSPIIVYQLNNGNAANLLVAGLVAGRVAQHRGRGEWLGVAIAIAASVKLAPAVLVVWLILQKDRRGLLGFAIATAAIAALSLAGSGIANHFAYLDVIRSAPGDSPVRAVLITAGIALAVALRRRPSASFATLVMAFAWGTPAFGEMSLIFVIAALPLDLAPRDRRSPAVSGQ